VISTDVCDVELFFLNVRTGSDVAVPTVKDDVRGQLQGTPDCEQEQLIPPCSVQQLVLDVLLQGHSAVSSDKVLPRDFRMMCQQPLAPDATQVGKDRVVSVSGDRSRAGQTVLGGKKKDRKKKRKQKKKNEEEEEGKEE
jgi:hypothetical protein